MKFKHPIQSKAYTFSLNIIKLSKTLPRNEASFVISKQLLRSSTSIGANLVEAKSSSSRRDFIKFYEIALKSANETIYWIGLLFDSELINKETYIKLIVLNKELCRLIAASLITLKGKRRLDK